MSDDDSTSTVSSRRMQWSQVVGSDEYHAAQELRREQEAVEQGRLGARPKRRQSAPPEISPPIHNEQTRREKMESALAEAPPLPPPGTGKARRQQRKKKKTTPAERSNTTGHLPVRRKSSRMGQGLKISDDLKKLMLQVNRLLGGLSSEKTLTEFVLDGNDGNLDTSVLSWLVKVKVKHDLEEGFVTKEMLDVMLENGDKIEEIMELLGKNFKDDTVAEMAKAMFEGKPEGEDNKPSSHEDTDENHPMDEDDPRDGDDPMDGDNPMEANVYVNEFPTEAGDDNEGNNQDNEENNQVDTLSCWYCNAVLVEGHLTTCGSCGVAKYCNGSCVNNHRESHILVCVRREDVDNIPVARPCQYCSDGSLELVSICDKCKTYHHCGEDTASLECRRKHLIACMKSGVTSIASV